MREALETEATGFEVQLLRGVEVKSDVCILA